uniref:Uncharacterized protein n=1 Tax=Oryza sativa subsp. japonica TaxID=39947 RepID=Q2R4F5_ORYSJ|nr:hypothetical protein LOC_Os11g28660 [Oryza sativa Japonica Group]
MRLLNPILPESERKDIYDFSQWVLAVGNGSLPMIARENESCPTWITIPDDLLVMTNGDKISAIVNEVYPDFLHSYKDIEYLASRAIVCPNNITVDEINDYVIGLIPGDPRIYLSCDTISKCSELIPDFDLLYPPEFLNSINATNFPTHKLILKEGAVVMLLRNLNQSIGLCNGTRLLVTGLGDRILQCTILTGSNIGEIAYIPRITLSTTKMKWPFTLQRRQFPVRVCYSMTINKSQGQTLQRVGVYLRRPVFTHGQLSKMVHVLISQLACGDLNTRILARVSRLWDFSDLNDSSNIFHTNVVLLDQMGKSIHAQIYHPVIGVLKPLLQEQKVYYIDSFTVDVMGVITEVGAPAIVRPKSRNTDSLKRTIQICDASNSTLPVTLWGDKAAIFDADTIYNAGQTQPQVIVFVGMLVKDYPGLGLIVTGSSPCQWYLNLDIPEVLELKESFSANFRAIAWVDNPATGYNQDIAEEKKILEILALNPHKNRSTRFIVTVTVKKICTENSWWYNSCRMCYRTSRPYGSTYKCSGCSNIGIPDPRYKVVLIAGDDSCDATFILFGRIAHRLIRRPVESLIEDNPPNSEYIPSEIAALIDGKFVWNVSFTRNTVKRSQESLQVNSIVSTASSGHSLLLMPPDTSQATSAIVSAGSSSSVQIAPPVSETSTGSHQAIEPGHNASTPTKLAIGSTTHDTPTSKPCHSTPSKKNIVVSMCHVQSASPSLPTDTKADAKVEEDTSQHASSTPLVAHSAEHKEKQPAKHEENIPQTSPSSLASAIAKKRCLNTSWAH